MKFNTPKPNQIYYKGYFFVGLLKHPQRLWNYIKYKFSKFKSEVSYLPLMMDLEPKQRCNYRCIMCDPFKIKRQDMTFEEYKKIIDEQVGLMEIKIQGVGEPLLNKDFFKMLEYAKSKHLWVRTTTNGSLLEMNDNYRKLVDTGVHDINISLDGADKEIYEEIRRGGNFENIVKCCRLLNDYNNKTKKTIVRAWVVIQKQNKHQFFEFPKFFADLGFKEMTYSLSMHNYGREGDNEETTSYNFTEEDYRKLQEICDQVGIKLTFFFHPQFNSQSFCKIPFKRVYVTTDSHIVPCCYIGNQEIVNFGSYQDFNNIWYSKYKGFRRCMKDGKKVPEYCKQCYGELE